MSRLPILNPKVVPVLSRDSHLPPVAPALMQADAVRARFAAPPEWAPEFQGDGPVPGFEGRQAASAAVLVPLVMRPQGLQLLLTRRTEHLRSHAGQISFPGGRIEPEDAGVEAAALRETQEEIGLDRAAIEVIGRLPLYTTVTSFQVTPVVALVQPEFTLTLDAFEVAEAFEVPLSFLMTPAHHQRHRMVFEGGERFFYSMPWTQEDSQGALREYFIWGATAAILRNFYRFLSA
ncbi:CoA pyrophosphatase [Roseateles koreensis]|uniref:CoA pyrophosphatase n=1 Tax=Roseateles koreensis TaxID=2987526 RepID=A0ABT5KW60_9BURK|nr:CoA pyrophosphatase [Roseateles koreensis]MDC8786022.1 CoA pyrophosphatase [Roseateles koreensis]